MGFGGWLSDTWESMRKGFTSIAENGIYLSLLPAVRDIGMSVAGRSNKTIGESFSEYFKGLQGIGTGVGQILAPLVMPNEENKVPGLYQTQWTLSKLLWLYDRGLTYGVRRPITTAMLAGDIADTGEESFFDRETWRRAWNQSEFVTPGQAVTFNAAQLFGFVDPADRVKYDPRTQEGRKVYYENPWFQGVSGSLDFAVSFVDIGKGATALTRRGIGAFPGQGLVKPTEGAITRGGLEKEAFGRQAEYGDSLASLGGLSKSYQRVFDAANKYDLDRFQRLYFNQGAFGGVAAANIWSLGRAGDKQLFADAMMASRGSYPAWQRLQDRAPDVALNIGRARQAHNIPTAVANYGKDQAATESVDGMVDTAFKSWVQSFAKDLQDAGTKQGITDNQWQYFLHSTKGQSTIRATILDKMRVGVHQWTTAVAPTTVGSWSRGLARTFNPAARYAAQVDVNAANSYKTFRYNIERAPISPEAKARFSAQYMTASGPEQRSGIIAQAEEVVLNTILERYGVPRSSFDQYKDELAKLRAISRDMVDKTPRHIPSMLRQEAERLIASGQTKQGMTLKAVADNYGAMAARGEVPEVSRATFDDNANLSVIPEENGIDPEKPFFQSTTANLAQMTDYRALEASIKRYLAPMRRLEQRALGLQVGGSQLADVINLNAYKAQQRALGVLQGLQTAWAAVAIFRPAQPIRSGADELMRAATQHGLLNYLISGMVGSQHLWARTRRRETLAQRWARAKVSLLLNRGDKPDMTIDADVDLDDPKGLNVDKVEGFYQIYERHADGPLIYKDGDRLIGARFDSMEAALVKGVMPLSVYTDLVLDMTKRGHSTTDLDMLVDMYENGMFDRDSVKNERRFKQAVAEYALDQMGVSAFTNPQWQQNFMDTVTKQGSVIVDPLTASNRVLPPTFVQRLNNAVQGKDEVLAESPFIHDHEFIKRAFPRAQRELDKLNAEIDEFLEETRDVEFTTRPTREELLKNWSYWPGREGMAVMWAVDEYRHGLNKAINNILRGKTLKDELADPSFASRGEEWLKYWRPKIAKRYGQAREAIKHIDKVMKHAKSTADVIVYRGLTFPQKMLVNPSKWKPGGGNEGQEFYDPSFVSTSSDKEHAMEFGKPRLAEGKQMEPGSQPTMLRVLVPKGTRAVNLGTEEYEMLLDRGLRMRIVSDHGVDDSGVHNLDVEVVTKSTPSPKQIIDAKRAQGVFDEYEPGPAVEIMPEADGYMENDKLYDFLMEHREKIVDGRWVLHGAPSAGGGLRATLVRPRGAPRRVAERMTREQRRDMVKGLSQLGRSDLVVKSKAGQSVTIKGVFAGMDGDYTRSAVASRTQLNAVWANTVSVKNAARMIIKNSRLKNHKPGDRGYEAGWEYYTNAVVANDPVARMTLEGRDYDYIMSWLDSRDGESWLRRRQQPLDPRNHVLAIMGTTERLVPNVGNLRAKVLRHEASAKDLDEAFPNWRQDDAVKAGMPDVLGQSDAMAFGGLPGLDWLRQKTDNLFRVMIDMPIDRLTRFPFASIEYQKTAVPMVRSYIDWAEREGKPILADEIHRIEDMARQHTIDKVQQVLYDTSSRTDAASALQYFMPFSSAITDSVFKWMNLFVKRPVETIGNWQWYLYAPERMGVVYDQDGNHYSRDKNGNDVWTNVVTGERAPERTPEGKKIEHDRYVLMRVPQQAGKQALEREGGKFFTAFNKDSLNPILSVPTAGPIVALPMNRFVLSNPEYADDPFIKTFILPFGPTDRGALDQLMPGMLRSYRNWRNDQDNKDLASSTAMDLYVTWMTEWKDGKRAKMPTIDEAKDAAFNATGMRLLASPFSPVPIQSWSPYKPYVDYYRQLVRQHKGDERLAMRDFQANVGNEFMYLTAHVTKANVSMPATESAYKAYEKYRPLIEQNPDVAGLITGGDGAGTFNKAVYEWQKTIRINGNPLRKPLTIQESLEDVELRSTWDEYSKLQGIVTTKLRERGLTSLNQRGAEDIAAMRQTWIEQHKLTADGANLSAWYKDLQSTDASVIESRVKQMRNVLQNRDLVNGRQDLQVLAEYLVERDRFQGLMREYGYRTLDSKRSQWLREQWDRYVFTLTERHNAFSDLYSRWLTNDRLELRGGE